MCIRVESLKVCSLQYLSHLGVLLVLNNRFLKMYNSYVLQNNISSLQKYIDKNVTNLFYIFQCQVNYIVNVN